MKNLIKIFGIIALVAIIGFSMTACKSESNIPVASLNGFSTSTPPSDKLTAAGLTEAEYKPIVDAGGSGYQGWREGSLELAWTGKNTSDFNNVVAELKKLDNNLEMPDDVKIMFLGFIELTPSDVDFTAFVYGTDHKYFAMLFLTKKSINIEGENIPANVLMLILEERWFEID